MAVKPVFFSSVGGNDPEIYAKAKAAGKLNELPVNHSPHCADFASDLETGVEALIAALASFSAS